MDESLKIYVDHLKQGKIERIDRKLPPDFLGVEEPDLCFKEDVHVRGEAYIASDGLVLHLDIETVAIVPCSICNEPVKVSVQVKGVYHVEALQAIKAGVFNLGEVVRESVLIETPTFTECDHGKCPKRKTIERYLKKGDLSSSNEGDEGYRPFSNFKLE